MSTTLPLLDGVKANALLSPCGRYRYMLTREGEYFPQHGRGHVLWIMLNPSLGDAELDDRTLRRCQGFARSWGYDGITVANLFAIRSKSPAILKSHPDPVGPANDDILQGLFAASGVGLIVAAWGTHGVLRNRGLLVQRMADQAGRELHHVGLTAGGQPGHPLYLPDDTTPTAWSDR